MRRNVDIAIAGGGLTGCLTALVLQRKFPAAKIVLLDQHKGAAKQDPRGLALALRTQQVLQEHGVWQGQLLQSPAIQHIHVSDANSPGTATMHAKNEQLPALGYVAMAGALQSELTQRCTEAAVEHVQAVEVANIAAERDGLLLTLNDEQQIGTRLLIVAEGSNSPTRAKLGIMMKQEMYSQVAVAAKVKFAKQHRNWAFERFTAEGPAALLPQGHDEAALVWCMHTDTAEKLQASSRDERVRAVQNIFGAAPGRIANVEYQATFPLQLAMAERFVGYRSVVIGNACHTLHPVAGQGYNLGVRDILDLAANIQPADFGSHIGLNTYQAQRERDYAEIIGLTHGLVAVFSNQEPVWRNLRSKGLYALRALPALKKPLMRKAMGFRSLW
ncbi:hypothetical protein CWE08_08360 [Aliidiomarina iranensis]|uniref:FAD-binding domain-containing protein n=1 Tax=Aliidiomarina iranensis TaxID=1434071 RepID=A0A432VVE6_9GAMM|nr:FAD-dependent monooxygenase [Aliidiomarina iranensis]RUO20465.1 hypothetical protein CWE08_08360 [Aliidiomarina iranensis]